MDHVSLVAIASLCMTQGGAGTRSARACLPWAMLFNAVGVRMPNVPQGGLAELVQAYPGLCCLTPLAYAGRTCPGWSRGARASLPWAMLFNAVGVCVHDV